MKILSLSIFYPRSNKGEITGGVEARNFYIDKFINQHGHTFKVLPLYKQDVQGEDYSVGSLPRLIRIIYRGIQVVLTGLKDDFDLVEGTNFATFIFAWTLGRLKQRPVIFWYPDVWLGQWKSNIGTLGFIGELLEKTVLALPVDNYITISQTVADKLIASGISKNKITVIYCGVDPKVVHDIQLKRLEKKWDVITVSRLVKYKNLPVLISAVKRLTKEFPRIQVGIIGQGSEKEKLLKLVGKLDLRDNISFLEYFPRHKDLLEEIARARIFCFTSTVEGFGIAAIEAAALGIPSVISDIPVLREITRGEAGLLFRPKNTSDLASKINNLLSSGSLYKRKSQTAKILAQEYDWKTVSQKTVHVYQDVLKRKEV